MNRILCLATVALAFACTNSANAQGNINQSHQSVSDLIYDFEVYTGEEGRPTAGYSVVIYRSSGVPEYVGVFRSYDHANYWAIQQIDDGPGADWLFYEIEFSVRTGVRWELQGTYGTQAQADLAVDIFEYLGYDHIKIERVNGMQSNNRFGN